MKLRFLFGTCNFDSGASRSRVRLCPSVFEYGSCATRPAPCYIGRMRKIRNSLTARILLTAAVVLLAAPAVYRAYCIFRADRIVRSEQTIESYSRAIEFDPSNSVLWWNRGRLRHYSVKDFNIAGAAADYQHALNLNPRLSQAWVDLSDCLERMGRYQEAEAALEKAFAAHKYSPLIRWQAGNFFLRRGNLPKMYECFKLASQYQSDKLAIAIDIAWKIDPDHAEILDKLVPDDIDSNLNYLGFLVSRDELDLAARVWSRCVTDTLPHGLDFKPNAAFQYIERLLAKSRFPEARQVWEDALRKSGIALKPASENLVWNGSFEREILQGGFDWRYPDIPEVRIRIDSSNRIHELKTLRLTFEDANISSWLLNQIVLLPAAGSYKLDFYVRTEKLTTDQLPYIAIQGFPDPAGASAPNSIVPSSADWSRIAVPFTVGESCRAVELILRRDKSQKFDNQIKGTMWLDGFSIKRQ